MEEFIPVSNPQATTVTTIISQKAAGLANLLAQEGVSATAVEALTATDPAYLWCQETLALMVAVRLLQLASGKDPKLAEVWRDELVARLKDLAERGAAALGNASLDTSDSPANGPATHITYLGLDLPDAAPHWGVLQDAAGYAGGNRSGRGAYCQGAHDRRQRRAYQQRALGPGVAG